jgi:hypothetical protein
VASRLAFAVTCALVVGACSSHRAPGAVRDGRLDVHLLGACVNQGQSEVEFTPFDYALHGEGSVPPHWWRLPGTAIKIDHINPVAASLDVTQAHAYGDANPPVTRMTIASSDVPALRAVTHKDLALLVAAYDQIVEGPVAGAGTIIVLGPRGQAAFVGDCGERLTADLSYTVAKYNATARAHDTPGSLMLALARDPNSAEARFPNQIFYQPEPSPPTS